MFLASLSGWVLALTCPECVPAILCESNDLLGNAEQRGERCPEFDDLDGTKLRKRFAHPELDVLARKVHGRRRQVLLSLCMRNEEKRTT